MRTKIGLALLCVAAALPAMASTITFSVFTDPHTNPAINAGTISIAYAGNMFVGSVQRDGTSSLYSTDLTGGNVQLFAPQVSLAPTDAAEHFLASSLGLGGFPSRDIYAASGNGVMHITNDGSSSNVFVSGLAGNVRGILFDPVGTFGNDMLVTTDQGNIYRVNSGGQASLLASVGQDTEGMDVAPLSGGFGSFNGQLIVASEGSGLLRAITPGGTVTVLNQSNPVPGAEMVSFVPENLGASGPSVEGFYAADYAANVVFANASQFQPFLGDVVVTGEFTHQVTDVHWNGTGFDETVIGQFPNQPEDGIFVTTKIINPTGNAPEPASAILVLAGVGALGLRRLRRA